MMTLAIKLFQNEFLFLQENFISSLQETLPASTCLLIGEQVLKNNNLSCVSLNFNETSSFADGPR